MGNKSKRKTLASKALGAQIEVLNLRRELLQNKSDMAIISKAFIDYVANAEKKSGTEALEKVNAVIAETVKELNNDKNNCD